MTRRSRAAKIFLIVLGCLALLLAAGYVALRTADIGALVRGTVVERLEAATGREVTLAGDFDVAASLAPTVTAEGVRIANAPWGSAPTMLDAGRIAVTLQVLPLLNGEVVVDDLVLSEVEVLLETDETGTGNWEFSTGGGGAPSERSIVLDEVTVTGSRLIWRDGATGRTETVAVETLTWRTEGAEDTVALALEGSVDERPLAVSGQIGSLSALMTAAPYPVELDAALGGIMARVEGRIGGPNGASALSVTMRGPEFAELGDLLGRPLPGLGPFEAAARIEGALEAPRVPEISARIGEPDGLHFELADGRIADPAGTAGIEAAVTAEGPSLAAVGTLADVEIPELGPFAIEGRLTGSLGAPALEDIQGRAGTERAAIEITDGGIGDLAEFAEVRLPFAVEAVSLAPLGVPAGMELPDFGPVRVSGVLAGSGGSLALADIEARAGGEAARVAVEGAIGELLSEPALDLAATAEGGDLAALTPLVGVDLPAGLPFRVTGQVDGTLRALRIEGLDAEIAETRLAGNLEVALPEDGPPAVEGTLTADRLDLDRLTGPDRVPDEAPDEAVDEDVAATAPAGDAEEADPLPVAWLDDVSAHLRLRAERITAGGVEIGNAETTVDIEAGRMAVRDLTLTTAEGSIAADATVAAVDDAEAGGEDPSVAEVTLRLNADDLDIGDLLSDTGLPTAATGEIDIDITIDGTGRSVDALLADLEGEAAVLGEGRIQDTKLNYLVPDVDLLRILPFWRRADTIRMNCLVGRFDIEDGVARTRALLDTPRMTLVGKGTVALGAEELDLALRPAPKSRKLSAAAVPVDIGGTFSDPEIQPLAGETAGRLLGGLLGGLLVPLNQLASMFGEETADVCGEALRQAGGSGGGGATEESAAR